MDFNPNIHPSSQPRVLTGFANASDHDIEELAGAVSAQLYGNPTFPDPPVTQVNLQAGLTAFTDALAAQSQGGTQATAAKEQTRLAFIGLLRQLALFVGTVLLAQPGYGLAELLSSGFDAVSTNRELQPLDPPSIVGIDNSGEGPLTLRIGPVANARQYEVQFQAAGATDWTSAGMYNSTRGMTVHDLTPGTMYTFRVRALGGSTGQSDWSDPVSHRSL